MPMLSTRFSIVVRSLYAWSGTELAIKFLWIGVQVLGRCPSWGGEVLFQAGDDGHRRNVLPGGVST